ncbi:MAG: HypC/HybG/HupF family hydrogenase formation chaperone [Nitrospiraceae bacterium]|nr:HypC/HybG/HupF family hydrogenase formation chaperone [Nitrospiraceae bacterium]MDA8208451.1 HypC/HybG/HupF family hydrogenase formation chaperone [Actinomycetota bacterium]
MCLGIPAQVIGLELMEDGFAEVEVAEIRRQVHLGMLAGEEIALGDWLLVHVGFAIAKLDEEAARRQLEFQDRSGQVYKEELEAFSGLEGGVGP